MSPGDVVITLKVPDTEADVANACDMCIIDGMTLILARFNKTTLDYYLLDRDRVSDSESD